MRICQMTICHMILYHITHGYNNEFFENIAKVPLYMTNSRKMLRGQRRIRYAVYAT